MHFFSRRPEVIERSNSIRDANKFTFIYVGRIVRDKGINELISAFTRLNTKFTSTRLILVGKYEHDLDPIDTASDEIIKNHPAIEYVGPQFKEDLLAYYVASDCFVFPSYREGFPNVVLEAGAMGLPCIVTNINGSREIIIDGENGLITPSKDSLCLYEAMQRIIMEKDLCQEMSKKTRKLIADRFEQSFVQKCQFDFYNSILI